MDRSDNSNSMLSMFGNSSLKSSGAPSSLSSNDLGLFTMREGNQLKISRDPLALFSQSKIINGSESDSTAIQSLTSVLDMTPLNEPVSSSSSKEVVDGVTTPQNQVSTIDGVASVLSPLESSSEDLWNNLNKDEKLRALVMIQKEIQVSQTTPGVEEKFYSVDTYKTEMCKAWVKHGECPYKGKCLFAHGTHELRRRVFGVKYKTKMCKNYHRVPPIGHCPYGSRCRYVHDLTEMKDGQTIGTSPVELSSPERKALDERKKIIEKLSHFDLIRLVAVMDHLELERRNLLIRPVLGSLDKKLDEGSEDFILKLILKGKESSKNGKGDPDVRKNGDETNTKKSVSSFLPPNSNISSARQTYLKQQQQEHQDQHQQRHHHHVNSRRRHYRRRRRRQFYNNNYNNHNNNHHHHHHHQQQQQEMNNMNTRMRNVPNFFNGETDVGRLMMDLRNNQENNNNNNNNYNSDLYGGGGHSYSDQNSGSGLRKGHYHYHHPDKQPTLLNFLEDWKKKLEENGEGEDEKEEEDGSPATSTAPKDEEEGEKEEEQEEQEEEEDSESSSMLKNIYSNQKVQQQEQHTSPGGGVQRRFTSNYYPSSPPQQRPPYINSSNRYPPSRSRFGGGRNYYYHPQQQQQQLPPQGYYWNQHHQRTPPRPHHQRNQYHQGYYGGGGQYQHYQQPQQQQPPPKKEEKEEEKTEEEEEIPKFVYQPLPPGLPRLSPLKGGEEEEGEEGKNDDNNNDEEEAEGEKLVAAEELRSIFKIFSQKNKGDEEDETTDDIHHHEEKET